MRASTLHRLGGRCVDAGIGTQKTLVAHLASSLGDLGVLSPARPHLFVGQTSRTPYKRCESLIAFAREVFE
jgi:hypothetical protein